MKKLASLLAFAAVLSAPLASSAAVPQGSASLPATSFSFADIGWEENPLDQLQAARECDDVKPIRQSKSMSDAAPKPAAEKSPLVPVRIPSPSKSESRDSVRDNPVERFFLNNDSGFLAWR